MNQHVRISRRAELASVIDFVAASVRAARVSERPFTHLEFDRVFPEDLYADMVGAMPLNHEYRALPGRHRANIRADGISTRVKIDLLPEYIRHMPPEKRAVWDLVGYALCSAPVRDALVSTLAAPLERRFGPNYASVRLHPIPILTRDIPGYRITPHTDTHWKAITVQFYLPRDAANAHIGTIFHSRKADGKLARETQMPFVPNSGYAFAVGDDTWHSADTVGSEVETRDSILLTYFDDAGLLRLLRNRGKRVGNFLLNEFRFLTR
jgi:hypothetical protein